MQCYAIICKDLHLPSCSLRRPVKLGKVKSAQVKRSWVKKVWVKMAWVKGHG